MVCTILAVGALAVLLLFAWAAIQTAGRCSRQEEEEAQRRWEEMQQRERSSRP